jgi:cysteinyl-tRNA synthetase
MSKSLGNILTIKELVKHHDPEALRLYLLGTHYRSPLEFTEDRVREYARALDRLSTLIVEADHMAAGRIQDRRSELTENAARRVLGAIEDGALRREITEHVTSFHNAMDDDFNTPEALGALFQLSHVLYRYWNSIDQEGRRVAFQRGVEVLFILGRVLGLFGQRRSPIGLPFERRAEIEQLIAQREDARKRRDWKRADEIRDRLLREYEVSVEDTPAGTRWKWKGA